MCDLNTIFIRKTHNTFTLCWFQFTVKQASTVSVAKQKKNTQKKPILKDH